MIKWHVWHENCGLCHNFKFLFLPLCQLITRYTVNTKLSFERKHKQASQDFTVLELCFYVFFVQQYTVRLLALQWCHRLLPPASHCTHPRHGAKTVLTHLGTEGDQGILWVLWFVGWVLMRSGLFRRLSLMLSLVMLLQRAFFCWGRVLPSCCAVRLGWAEHCSIMRLLMVFTPTSSVVAEVNTIKTCIVQCKISVL